MSRSSVVSKQYQKKSHLEHIKTRPDTYIGSCEKRHESMWVWHETDKRLEKRTIGYVPGLLKIFDEILVNAADNKQRDPNMKYIKINLRREFISVENDGAGVPVVMHETEHMYVPQMVFGELLTGDNYDDSEDRVVGGRNGYGAKLANVFSTQFVVETLDTKSGKKYHQTWRNNMGTVSPPKITAAGRRKDFTRVTFCPDFARFGLTGLDDDMYALLCRRVVDLAGTTPADVRVYLNGTRLDIRDFKAYCKLYVPEIQHIRLNPRWEICIALAPDQQAQQVSFVNSICTTKGGEHVKCVADDVSRGIVELAARQFKDLDVRASTVRHSMFVFVNALITNPSFDSQTKELLTTRAAKFGPAQFKPRAPEKFLKSVIKHSGIVDEVLHFARAKSKRNMERKMGNRKKNKLTGVPKLDDANHAGTRRSQDCTLILTEGDSAKTLAIAGLSVIGRDKYGVFPLKGKLLNVRDASNAAVLKNAEVQNIMKIMGLSVGKTYTDTSALRYGHVMIMTDQDHDGSHIKGLIVNFFHHFWPTLLAIPNFLQVFITPIVKCTKRSQVRVFYTTPEFETWSRANTGWRIKYYKGLGTSSAREAKEYFRRLSENRIPFSVLQDGDDTLIDMCFAKKKVAARKVWIGQHVAGTHVNFKVSQMKYADFVNKEYIIMAVSSNLRGIPHVVDGLKPSQRKILFACLKRKLHTEIKVAQLAGYTSEHAAYHHGEMSLNGAIIGMAQNYVGSNNIHLLTPNGQFGTRLMGGKDAASPRYVFTQLNKVTEKLFHPDDSPLLRHLEDDGQTVEPEFYVPVLPMLLVNGAHGIGTGWSTSIPSFNPADILKRIRQLLDGRTPTRMTPWYHGFKGIVQPVSASRFTVRGVWQWTSASTLHITELPVGTWTNTYKEMLERGLEGDSLFKRGDIVELKSNYTDTTVSFTVKLSSACAAKLRGSEDLLVKTFRLQKTVDLGNMHAFDPAGKIRLFRDELEILQVFFETRLALYTKRKASQLAGMAEALSVAQQKSQFIQAIVRGDLVLTNRTKADLESELQRRGFVHKELLHMPLWSLTAEKAAAARNDCETLQVDMACLQSMTPQSLWRADLKVVEEALGLVQKRARNA